MIPLIIYTVAVFGFAYLIGHSVISKPWRELIAWWAYDPMQQARSGDGQIDHDVPLRVTSRPWAYFLDLIECPACLGFWVGLIFGTCLGLTIGPSAVIFPGPAWMLPPVAACFTTGSNFILGRLTGLMPR